MIKEFLLTPNIRLTKTEQLGIAANPTTSMTYDAAGNLTTVTDPENKTTPYTYTPSQTTPP